jgi:multisubunit Na+/H+ antiporter MnhG subunit
MLGGLAIVHGIVARRQASRGWLVLLYLLLLLVPLTAPYVAMLLALAGFTDGWVRYRERISPTTS